MLQNDILYHFNLLQESYHKGLRFSLRNLIAEGYVVRYVKTKGAQSGFSWTRNSVAWLSVRNVVLYIEYSASIKKNSWEVNLKSQSLKRDIWRARMLPWKESELTQIVVEVKWDSTVSEFELNELCTSHQCTLKIRKLRHQWKTNEVNTDSDLNLRYFYG